jgi:hypothetical protein
LVYFDGLAGYRQLASQLGIVHLESIVPRASKMPLYRFINDLFLALGEISNVKLETDMADKTTADLLAA